MSESRFKICAIGCFVGGMAVLPGCDAEREAARVAVATPSAADVQGLAEPAPGEAGPAPVRGRIVGGERISRRVTTPRAALLDLEVRDRLQPALIEALALAPAPVLVPRAGNWAQLGALHNGPTWSAFEAHDADVHVNVSVSTQARRHPDIRSVEFPDIVRGHQGFVTRNEGIWSASWIENGAAYAIEIECGAQADPAQCADDKTLRSLAESLTFVGGGGVDTLEPNPAGEAGGSL